MTRSEILVAFVTNLRRIAPSADLASLDESTDLQALGADSLDLVEAIYRTMEEVQAPVPSREISDVTTVGELVTLLEQVAAGSRGSRVGG